MQEISHLSERDVFHMFQLPANGFSISILCNAMGINNAEIEDGEVIEGEESIKCGAADFGEGWKHIR